MVNICLCDMDWTAMSALSNMAMVFIALCSLIFSICLLLRERKLRKEDLRARLDFSIVKYANAYYLLIENVGKEAAYDVNISVQSRLIEEGLYEQVRLTFSELGKTKFIIKGGDKKYFFLCPDRLEKDVRCYWRKTESIDVINQWVEAHEIDEISVYAKYNNRFKLTRRFCIKNFNFIGETKMLSPIEQVSGVISDMDNFTLDGIKQQLCIITNSIDEIKQNHLYENE